MAFDVYDIRYATHFISTLLKLFCGNGKEIAFIPMWRSFGHFIFTFPCNFYARKNDIKKCKWN